MNDTGNAPYDPGPERPEQRRSGGDRTTRHDYDAAQSHEREQYPAPDNRPQPSGDVSGAGAAPPQGYGQPGQYGQPDQGYGQPGSAPYGQSPDQPHQSYDQSQNQLYGHPYGQPDNRFYGQSPYDQDYGQSEQGYRQPYGPPGQYGQYGQSDSTFHGQPQNPSYGQSSGQPQYGQGYGQSESSNPYGAAAPGTEGTNPYAQPSPAFAPNAPNGPGGPNSGAYGAPNGSAGAPFGVGTPAGTPNDGTATPFAANAAPPLDQPYYGCPPQEAFTRFFKKYATFSGRASRSEYWWWTLIAFVITAVLQGLVDVADNQFGIRLTLLTTLWQFGTLVPSLAISVRRLHDTDRPGGWIALPIALTFVGTLLVAGGLVGGIFGAAAALHSGAGFRSVITGGIVVIIGGLMALAGAIVDIVFMAMPSKPEGARFDGAPSRYGTPTDAYGNPYGGGPYGGNPYNGGPYDAAPYGNGPYAGQTPNGQAPGSHVPNGQESTVPPQNPPFDTPRGQ